MSLKDTFYIFYFCSLDGIDDTLLRYMHKDNHTVYVKEYEKDDKFYHIGIFNIKQNGERYLDKFDVPISSIHHVEPI